MDNLAEQLRRACGYEHIDERVRSYHSAATNGLVLDAAAEIDWLRKNLSGRDDFIGSKGLWDEFVASLPKTTTQADLG